MLVVSVLHDLMVIFLLLSEKVDLGFSLRTKTRLPNELFLIGNVKVEAGSCPLVPFLFSCRTVVCFSFNFKLYSDG